METDSGPGHSDLSVIDTMAFAEAREPREAVYKRIGRQDGWTMDVGVTAENARYHSSLFVLRHLSFTRPLLFVFFRTLKAVNTIRYDATEKTKS